MPRPAGAGNITLHQYKQLHKAYIQTESVEAAAKAAGLSLSTATKYVYRGTERFPAIYKEIKKLSEQYVEKTREEYHKLLTGHAQVNKHLFARAVDGLKNIKLEPIGRHDANGNLVVSPTEYKKLVDIISSVLQHGTAVEQALNGNPISATAGERSKGVTVNVNTAVQNNVAMQTRNVATGDSAKDFLIRHAGLFDNAEQESAANNPIVTALAQEARIREGATVIEIE